MGASLAVYMNHTSFTGSSAAAMEHRESVITAARIRARIFFMLGFLLLYFDADRAAQ
jgi:hypothetical protein